MDVAIARGLNDKLYEKRKTAALDLEKLVRDCHQQNDHARINQITDQLVDLFASPSQPMHCRNGGLIGLAATAIALGFEISPYMDKFIEPLLRCFGDQESRIRYFACESMYNIAKVSKGEILVYFNPIFDSLSKLAADSEVSVKNGAELLDRLLKDIVAESAPIHFPHYPETEKVRARTQDMQRGLGITVPEKDGVADGTDEYAPHKKAFSLAHFIPLLAERIYVISPFTRSYLVSWIHVLDSVPDLELVTFLPDFLDGLLKYLSDPTVDVRVSTENLLAEFLQEVRDIAVAQKRREEKLRSQRDVQAGSERNGIRAEELLPDITVVPAGRQAFIQGDDGSGIESDGEGSDVGDEIQDRDTGAWMPGQGVSVNHAAIVEIMIRQLDPPHDEIQQSTALRWIAEFMDFAPNVMVPFTPRLIPAILPNLAHHVPDMQSAAIETEGTLFALIQSLPSPVTNVFSPPASVSGSTSAAQASQSISATSPLPPMPPSPAPPPQSAPPARQLQSALRDPATSSNASIASREDPSVNPDGQFLIPDKNTPTPTQKVRSLTNTSDSTASGATPTNAPVAPNGLSTNTSTSSFPSTIPESRSQSPTQSIAIPQGLSATVQQSPVSTLPLEELDPFDYQATVISLTVQFMSEHEDTRVAALKWLIMLHQKAPKKILAMDDGTFPALLKILSDESDEVIKHDLRLLAQISSSSEESYFRSFMLNLLELFSTDRKLLEQRGSLIIRQLCLSLNTERIWRCLAEILEKEEDLEFASIMVQKLNIILITSPELLEFRKRLKNLESRVRLISWCHNAVAVLSLCFLAQAYEHASNLLQIFADLEITVQLLVQIDKLVQLIESPVFTYLRLQLLEPEKYPYLFKCLYGLLMLLPQSSAFISLRNRLNAVSSLGFLQIAPRSGVSAGTLATRSKIVREEIKWQELLSHFRAVQLKHERSRRLALTGGVDLSSAPSYSINGEPNSGGVGAGGGNGLGGPASKTTGERPPSSLGSSRPPGVRRRPSATGAAVLSPLNPKARLGPVGGTSGAVSISSGAVGGGGGVVAKNGARPLSPNIPEKQRRQLGLKGK
ncbi:hypothetical protein FRB96_007633 [Tulasnella sp. 330]|nr:hypothetical protein FRB96_007633 [Tulasnella sp. 330]